jgi:hexulose-6-phosphate isomerase
MAAGQPRVFDVPAPRIGFVQGRLSPQVNGKIQAFPWEHWRAEFAAAQRLGFGLMEWTLDLERLHENPFMTAAGQAEIRALKSRHGVEVASLTGDFFMQAPFHRAQGAARERCLRDLHAVCEACAALSVRYLVIPLVDGGRIDRPEVEADVLRTFGGMAPRLQQLGVSVAFESDYAPDALASFIGHLPKDIFGINYDVGNSASLGFDPISEIGAFGERILNVHVKDRVRGGTTVPLGTGNADFVAVFSALRRARYSGDFILQTARAADGNHESALRLYRDMTRRWIAEHQHAA